MNNIIVYSILAWWLSEGLGLVQTIKWWLKIKRIWYKEVIVANIKTATEKRLKPFDCPLCMGWWIGLLSSYYQTGDLYYSMIIGVLSSFGAILISKLMNRL